MPGIAVQSPDIAAITLHKPIPLKWHIYGLPFFSLYPLYFYALFVKYDDWVKSEEWTFLYTVGLFAGHALSFLATRWSVRAKALITCTSASSLKTASIVRIIPHPHKGEGELVPLKRVSRPGSPDEISFTYQADKYIYTLPDEKAPVTAVLVSPLLAEPTFRRMPYPSDSKPPLKEAQESKGFASQKAVEQAQGTYGSNTFDIPVPTFVSLFAEHAVAPFFVFQVFCVGLWMLDEYWYYSLFTLFMLIVFECTVVFQRLRTLNEFRTMSIKPFQVWTYRVGKWIEISSSELLPGDLVSITRSKEDSATPCDLLLLSGSTIVNEAMLSGESTPLLKESIELRDGADRLDINGVDRNNVVFGGTKVLQTTTPEADSSRYGKMLPPDGGALGQVLRTGFGTTQGQLIRLMVFTNEGRVSANNIESFLFIAFLLVFAIAASAYVWIRGNEMGRPKGKLLLDCVLIITSVVPPELPMELSMAVNASLMALAKFAIFCTEPFRIPFAGRVDVCCFDKTGTITGEDLEVQGVADIGAKGPESLKAVKACNKETTLTLAAAHALVLLEDGVVGDPMEKTTIDALDWKLSKGDNLAPTNLKEAPHKFQVNVRRRFQFSSALKRMSTISAVSEAGGNQRRLFVAAKGAPETLKSMYAKLPAGYDETYKGFTRRGSRVLALGYKWLDSNVNASAINSLTRDGVETGLEFAGFLVFHCPLKPDAVDSLRHLNESSHRCIMITGDNPLTAVHVAGEVEIVDRETLILDTREGASSESDLVWRNVDESIIIPVNPDEPIDTSLFDKYDICMTGVAMKQYEEKPAAWDQLVQNTWVYARVSPRQKEFILESLKSLGYITLMAGDGTNDVGALKAANVGIALLDGTPEDLQKIAEHQRNERMKKVYESQLNLTRRFGQPPPPVPPALKAAYPELEKARETALQNLRADQRNNPSAKFDMSSITAQMADMDDDGPPQIRLGDASVAAPFTSKLSNVNAIINIIRQGRCTLVAFTQMHKILALNCLISAYSLSVLYLDGIKYGDYQVTISGMLMSVCFLCISRAKPMERLSAQRPLSKVFSVYMLLSVLLQFALHVVTTHYLVQLVPSFETQEPVDLEAKFNPSLLNSAIFLIGLSQQVNTFSVNYIGQPHRESMRQNPTLYYGLVACFGVAFAGATELVPELNEWLQLVKLPTVFQIRLVTMMVIDFVGCYVIEWLCKAIFADQQPKPLVTKRREGMLARKLAREQAAASATL